MPPGFRSELRQIGDTRLHYVIGGTGPLVILLHGFPNTWYAWRHMMGQLAQTMTVLAVDLRGLGDSDAGTQTNDVPTTAQDLARGKPSEIDFLNGYVVRKGASFALASGFGMINYDRGLASGAAIFAGPSL